LQTVDTPQGGAGYEPVPNLNDQVDLASTAEAFALEWLRWLRDRRNRAERTLTTYADGLLKWLAYCEEEGLDPLRPSVTEMEAFIGRPRPRAKKGVGGPATQAMDVKVLHGWYNWLAVRGFILKAPSVELVSPTIPKRNPKPVPDESWVTIWSHDLPPRLRATLGMAYFGGLRREELVSIKCDQLTPTRIVDFTRKGGGEDTLPWCQMAEVVADRLPVLLPDLSVFVSAVSHVREHYDALTPWSSGHQLYKRMVRLCEQLDLAHYTPHQLRHSAATNLLRAGIPPHLAMRLMNHSSIDITMGYVKAGANELKEFLDMTRRGKFS